MKNWYLLIILQILIAIFSYLHFNHDNKKLLVSKDSGDISGDIKVFSPDWGISADLISLGVIPVAVAEQDSYNTWLGKPIIPQSSIDVGIRHQPNVELMATLYPDIIIDNGAYENNRPIYNKTIDIKSVKYGRDVRAIGSMPQWSTFATDMIKLGEYVNKRDIAENYVLDSKQEIIQAGVNIKKKLGNNRQFLVFSIWDSSELQVYNINNPISLSMNLMGLESFPMGKPTKWGVSSVPFHKIYDVPDNTCLVIVEPMSPFQEFEIKESLIWQQSEFSKADACIYRIKPIWMYGSFSTIKSFALNLEEEIANPRKNILSISTIEGQQ